ncbi:nucleoside 2-deoxyribosyltransferase domain-containing protein [Arthrobacter sp. zg-Y1110]|uniref:nucleoside 2-deoxyribosyltransferase domain-containing protein n=1 Tax=Arthrobacter sp. zg-Y1110 TaxID=2886932 RepID=UPI001D148BD2|nr:nucleoside 2-deoxyribosyltransferase domain-containing protein [Arthrobacter sp. zg-Y1110]MCC3291260.1 nucleoside 2-deoxyribosyltransferase domain-containing protein [Arthrobacter sp. zg-Y1110]UWX83686.1 nucleoside 2-deoxyribosyltransferase domain-containing protein [Arthrobacter sp. zg-Y1110]
MSDAQSALDTETPQVPCLERTEKDPEGGVPRQTACLGRKHRFGRSNRYSCATRRELRIRGVMDSGFSVYLAGKISKNGWRNELVRSEILGGNEWAIDALGSSHIRPKWDTIVNGLADGIHLTGPFFIGCDHGCGHGPGSHGVTGGCISSVASQQATVKLCLDAIDRSDVVFAWIDAKDAYGTLVELGYAKAKGKRIIVAHPPGPFVRSEKGDVSNTALRSDMWFLNTIADVEIAEHSAGAAWKRFLDWEEETNPT